MTLREKTTTIQESIGKGNFEAVALEYLDPFRYKQHNPNIASGRAAILALHDQLPLETTRAQVIRAFQDGDFGFVHVDYFLDGPVVAFDIHRFVNDRTVEHWDNLQAEPNGLNPSGHSMIDGATEVTDLDRTQENKLLVVRYVEDVLVRGKLERSIHYFEGDQLIQHSPSIADGTPALIASLSTASDETGSRYAALRHVFGEGNFVLAVCEGFVDGIHSSIYDLYRIKGSKIVEHWDVIEAIPEVQSWKNYNGKF